MLVGLTVMVVVAGLGAVIARLGKQPIIVGYIGAGVVLGWMSQGVLMGGNELNDLGGMSKVGVTLLLFLVGLELPIGEMRHLGRSVLGLAVTQVMVSVGLGMGLGLVLGLKLFDAAYFGLAGAFASTVIVVKMLGERRDLQSLYGRLATSLLLVQDFLAMGVLLMLSGVSVGGNRPNDWLVFGLAGVALITNSASVKAPAWKKNRWICTTRDSR
jgi:Kef-type K+ transport system membrane component KefB